MKYRSGATGIYSIGSILRVHCVLCCNRCGKTNQLAPTLYIAYAPTIYIIPPQTGT